MQEIVGFVPRQGGDPRMVKYLCQCGNGSIVLAVSGDCTTIGDPGSGSIGSNGSMENHFG